MLSNTDINIERANGNIEITPWNDKFLSIASYNVSASYFALSIKKGILERVYEKNDKNGKLIRYIKIKPNDTVLILTEEYLSISGNISGNVISRVSMVSKGLGHISTTIDPYWNGALLLALSNPFSNTINLTLCKEVLENQENNIQLATLTFDYVHSKAENTENNKLPARMDILQDITTLDTKFLVKLLHPQMSKCTKEVMNKLNLFPSSVLIHQNDSKFKEECHKIWSEYIEDINKTILTHKHKTKYTEISKKTICLIITILLVVICISKNNFVATSLIIGMGAFILSYLKD